LQAQDQAGNPIGGFRAARGQQPLDCSKVSSSIPIAVRTFKLLQVFH